MARKCVSHMLSFLLLAIFINKSFQDSPPRYEPKPSPQSPYGLSCFCLNHIHFKVQATNMFKLFLESYQCILNLDIYTCSFGQHLVLQTKNCYDPLLKRVFNISMKTLKRQLIKHWVALNSRRSEFYFRQSFARSI